MKAVLWGRLVIVLVVGMGLGGFPLLASAQSEQQPTTLQVTKQACLGRPENGCGDGLDKDAAGTTFDFLVTDLDIGEEVWIEVVIETSGKGATAMTNVLPGFYQVCESVPEGYAGFAEEGEGQVTYNNCVLVPVGEGERAVVTFDNWRVGVEDLPDTGVGLSSATGSQPWVPILLAGALLVLLAGLRVRSTNAR
jgi:hypothetical protein